MGISNHRHRHACVRSRVWSVIGIQSVDTGADTIALESVTQFSAWDIGIEGGDTLPVEVTSSTREMVGAANNRPSPRSTAT
jgi:hypothetical protein